MPYFNYPVFMPVIAHFNIRTYSAYSFCVRVLFFIIPFSYSFKWIFCRSLYRRPQVIPHSFLIDLFYVMDTP